MPTCPACLHVGAGLAYGDKVTDICVMPFGKTMQPVSFEAAIVDDYGQPVGGAKFEEDVVQGKGMRLG